MSAGDLQFLLKESKVTFIFVEHSFIPHSPSKYLKGIYYVPDALLGAEVKQLSKPTKILPLPEHTFK